MNPFNDLDVVPDEEFTRRLETVLLSDMGWPPSTPQRDLPARVAPVRYRRTALTVVGGLVAAAVLVVALFVGLAHRTPAPPTQNTVPQMTTTVPRPTTTPPPTSSANEPTSTPLSRGQSLETGTTYRVGRLAIGRPVEFRNVIEGAWGFTSAGAFAVAGSRVLGEVPLVVVFDAAKLRVMNDPYVDAGTLTDVASVKAASAPVADGFDIITYFGSLPGVEIGDVQETTFAGRPARMASWSIASIEGGHPCFGSSRGNCLVTGAVLAWVSAYTAGDSGILYSLDVDGVSVIVEVRDRPGAREIADSIVIDG